MSQKRDRPNERRCPGSMAEVMPSRGERHMRCFECQLAVPVVPYEHRLYGPSFMLAAHADPRDQEALQ